MSLRQQAAQVAQDTARQRRDAVAAHDAKMVAAIEDKITEFSGVPATFVDKRSVAYETYGTTPMFGGSKPRIVSYEDLYVFAVDDVLVGAKRGKNEYAFGDPPKYTYDYALVFEDPQRGSYRTDHSLMWYSIPTQESSEKRTAKFVATIARIGSPKHPAVVLAEKGERCPSCGRGYDEDRY